MSDWMIAAVALALGYVPLVAVIGRAKLLDRLVAAQMASVLTILELELLGQAFSESFYLDLAMAVALLSFPAGLAFVYFYARWV